MSGRCRCSAGRRPVHDEPDFRPTRGSGSSPTFRASLLTPYRVMPASGGRASRPGYQPRGLTASSSRPASTVAWLMSLRLAPVNNVSGPASESSRR